MSPTFRLAPSLAVLVVTAVAGSLLLLAHAADSPKSAAATGTRAALSITLALAGIFDSEGDQLVHVQVTADRLGLNRALMPPR